MTDQVGDGPAEMDPWSVSTHDLHEAIRRYRSSGTSAVIATVVAVEGSAYRRPGAMMLIDPDEGSYGAITAGCLEEPVKQLAHEVLDDGDPVIETFDLMETDGEWGLGLGCNGIIDILLEPLDEAWDPVVTALDQHDQIATATVVGSTTPSIGVGDRMAYTGDEFTAVTGRDPLPSQVTTSLRDNITALAEKTGSGSVSVETDAGTVEVYLDWIIPAPDLLLFGTQNDIHPVSKVGRQAGFRVIVASARGGRSTPEQFPYAHEVQSVRPMELADSVNDPERTYAVVMSHNLLEDRLAVDSLLEIEIPYLGLMGPRERFDELREERIADIGEDFTEEEVERIATPVGLDIGGGEPIQIAISIVAEALAVHHDREGGRLKERERPIHDRLQSVAESM